MTTIDPNATTATTEAAVKAPKVKKEKPVKEPRPQAEERNGVRRPLDATGIVGRVWAIAEAISEAMKAPAPRAAVSEQAQAEGLNVSTINTQYAKWRAFHGLTGTIVAAKEPKAPKAPKEPKAKKEKAVAEAPAVV
jgi:hypothetical protein